MQRPGDRSSLDELVEATEGAQPWRRLFHAAVGVLLAGLLWWVQPTPLAVASSLGVLAAILLALDLARLTFPSLNLVFFRTFRALASPREARGVASSTWYLVGTAICGISFPLDLVIPAILVLALADPAASYLGRRWGKRSLGTGSVEGTAVFVLISGAVLLPFVPTHSAILAAITAGLVETVPWKLDDNLVIPLAVAMVLWISGAG